MTVVAVLATAVRESPFFGDDRWMNPAFVCSTVAIAVASVWIWAGSQPWILRLGGTLGLAILLAGAVSLTVVPFTTVFSVIIGGHYLIQAIVLSIWLGCGPILTFSKAAAAPGPPTTLVQ
jgi:hypothetical protein